jgi:hypothetical protein
VAEGVDEATIEFSNEIAPQIRPRDVAGKFVATQAKPEPMFGERPIEGDERGDTRDGGSDPRLEKHEREVVRRPAREPDEAEDADQEPERISNEVRPDDDEGEPPAATDSGEKYEITVDGEPREVTLQEALSGYIRTETFHKRQAQLFNIQKELEGEYGRLQANWNIWHKARADYEEDLANMIPQEPNWDQEFARDPRAAHGQQKVYQILYGKLAASQQQRAQREQANTEDADRRLQKYAVEAFAKFVAMHPKIFVDEAALNKNLESMRRTAQAAGFSEYEVATVYDPRMLTVLLKASKYDRMQASRLKPVDPSRGKSVSPGAATPIGNARRSGFDQAQRQLASSGKLQDAVEVFRRML